MPVSSVATIIYEHSKNEVHTISACLHSRVIPKALLRGKRSIMVPPRSIPLQGYPGEMTPGISSVAWDMWSYLKVISAKNHSSTHMNRILTNFLNGGFWPKQQTNDELIHSCVYKTSALDWFCKVKSGIPRSATLQQYHGLGRAILAMTHLCFLPCWLVRIAIIQPMNPVISRWSHM